MSEIKYEIIKKIGVLSKATSGWAKNPLRPSDTSPKYDVEILNNYQAFVCRIWGRTGGGRTAARWAKV